MTFLPILPNADFVSSSHSIVLASVESCQRRSVIAGVRPGQGPGGRKTLVAVAGVLHGHTVVVALLAEAADTAVFVPAAVDTAVVVDIVAMVAVLDFAAGDGAAAAGLVEDGTGDAVGVEAAGMGASGCIVVEVDDVVVEHIHFPVAPKVATVVAGRAVVEAGLG